MKIENLRWCGAVVLCTVALPLAAQTPISSTQTAPELVKTAAPGLLTATQPLPATPAAANVPTPAPASHAVQALQSFRAADVKFNLNDLMEILRDRRHEGWVLAAYPDPKTAQPLIGAGVSLDLPARVHPQTDPMNPHDFIEPSSAELWQAAGLDPRRLDAILTDFHHRLGAWSKKGFRRKIPALSPQITDAEAGQLLRISVIQAIYNAKGYCRDFDRLTASQQMALSQLVFQMGVNLAEFSQFLDLINHYAESLARNDSAPTRGADFMTAGPISASTAQWARAAFATEADYWRAVQKSLVESQWARLYRMRAVAVIAMLDPTYVSGPGVAEQRVGAMLRPVVAHRRGGQHARRGPALRGSGARSAKMRRQKKRGV